MSLLDVRGVSRQFDGVQAVDSVSFSVAEGEFVSLIGPNGAGKTTLLNLISGSDKPTAGEIIFEGVSLTRLAPHQFVAHGIARTFQQGRVFGNLSVIDNVLIGAHSQRRLAGSHNPLLEIVSALVPLPAMRREDLTLRAEAESILAQFGDRLTPRLNDPASSLSYANRRRVEMARALAARPKLLLLDEPTAGMNLTETAEIQTFLQRLKARQQTIILIEHKLPLVMALSDRVIVMDNGRLIAEGLPDEIQRDPRVVEAYLGKSYRPVVVA